MPEKHWELVLNELGDRLWVQFVTERGQVVRYVIRGEAMIEGHVVQVVRGDSAHGRGHYDLLGRSGETIRKVWVREGLDLGDAFTETLADLGANWELYRAAFLRREP